MGGMQHLAWSQFPFTALCKTARHASPGAHQHGLHTSQGLVMSHQVKECMAVLSHKVSTVTAAVQSGQPFLCTLY
jgi:hypothetical protein